MLYILFIILLFILVIPLIMVLGKGLKQINLVEFYSMGKDAGFSFREIHLLRKVAEINQNIKASSLFWSVDALDQSLAGIHKMLDKEKDEDEQEYLRFLLKKMYVYRKKVELEKPKYSKGIESSRDIGVDQLLKLKVEGLGVYESTVVENNKHYLLISYPKGPPLPPGFSWRQLNLNIYFWREDDAGYFFQSRIMEGYVDKEFKTLRATHSDMILRSQKRHSIRTKCEIPGDLYVVKDLKATTSEPESLPGLRCIVKDLSEDGAAVLIGGRGRKNLLCKLQVTLYGKIAVLKGVVRTMKYDEEKKITLLHIQAEIPDEETRCLLLSFVYDIYRSDEPLDEDALEILPDFDEESEAGESLESVQEIHDPEGTEHSEEGEDQEVENAGNMEEDSKAEDENVEAEEDVKENAAGDSPDAELEHEELEILDSVDEEIPDLEEPLI